MTDIQVPTMYSADIEKKLAELDKTSDEEARIALEMTMPSAEATAPISADQVPTPSEVDTGHAAAFRLDPKHPALNVVHAASREVGYREKGDNDTKYGDWYGMRRAPWCDIFVSWVFHEAGQLAAAGGKHSYVPSHVAWFSKHKSLHLRGAHGGGPRVGCIVFFDLDGRGGTDHVGIVTSFTDSHVYTVEGNRSNQVKRVKYARSSHQIYGYGYPAWK